VTLDEVVRSAITRAGIVRVRSALNPFLWAIAWSAIFLSFAVIFRDDPWARYGLIALAAVPMLVTMTVGVYFALNVPDRLQSEEFVLKQLELSISERKGLPPPIDDPVVEDTSSSPRLAANEGKGNSQ